MADQQKKRTFADRLRELIESLNKALQPVPRAPQPIPVDDRRLRR